MLTCYVLFTCLYIIFVGHHMITPPMHNWCVCGGGGGVCAGWGTRLAICFKVLYRVLEHGV